MSFNNWEIFNSNWPEWLDMQRYGPASQWLCWLIGCLLDEIADPAEITSILDVGCGEGTKTFFLATRFPQAMVTGYDLCQSGILCAQANYKSPNLIFIHDPSAQSLNSSNDLVTCFEVLEHVDQWQEFLTRVVSATKKYLMLSFPVGRMRKFEKNVGHLRNFKKYEVEQFLSSWGFQPVKIYYAGFPFFSPLYRELCNLLNLGQSKLTKGKYGWPRLLTSKVLFWSFRHLSTRERWGDQFCGLFVNQEWLRSKKNCPEGV